jgi:hypothetical protein
MLVLDANILIRAVLGNRVRTLLITYAGVVDFFTPDVCMADAQKYLPLLFEKRSLPAGPALTLNCPIWTEDQDFFAQGSQHGQQIEFTFILKRLR